MSSGLEDERHKDILELTTDSSPIAVAMADRLAAVLQCEPTRDGLAAARTARLPTTAAICAACGATRASPT